MEYQPSQRFELDLPRLPFIDNFKAFTYTYYKNQTSQTNKQKNTHKKISNGIIKIIQIYNFKK